MACMANACMCCAHSGHLLRGCKAALQPAAHQLATAPQTLWPAVFLSLLCSSEGVARLVHEGLLHLLNACLQASGRS